MNPVALSLILTMSTAGAAGDAAQHQSKYAGEQTRAIKSLSADDVDQLRRGGGWGLAKAAELNGMPGPKHLLELRDEIQLTEVQVVATQRLFEQMRAEAMTLGGQLIDLEAQLDRKFATKQIRQSELKTLLAEIGRVRSELRFVHLATHLETPRILSDVQIARYRQLRGYDGDPCADVPSGHDEAMWKRHNNCE